MNKSRFLQAMRQGAADPLFAAKYHGKDSPSTPQAPNPWDVANAQNSVNRNTATWNAAMNRVNQNTPWGSVSYQYTPTGGQQANAGNPAAQSVAQMSQQSLNSGNPTTYQAVGMVPNQQQSNQSNQAFNPVWGNDSGGSNPYANQNQNQNQNHPAQNQYGQDNSNNMPGSWSSTTTLSPSQQNLFDLQNQNQTALGGALNNQIGQVTNALSTPFSTNGLPQVTPDALSKYVSHDGMKSYVSNASGGPIQGDVDLSGLQRLPGANDFSSDRSNVENAIMSRLQPQYDRDREQLQTQLANQGITQNSEAYGREMDAFNRSLNDARQQAVLSGGQEQTRMYNMALNTRQQGANELFNQGTFHNAAENQGFNQNFANAGLQNQVRNSQFAEGMVNAGLWNGAQSQQYTQNADAYNRALQQSLLQHNQPISEYNALRTGQNQVGMPQFGGVPQVGAAPGDIAGAMNNQYQGQLNSYNAQVGNQNSFMGGLMGMGSAAMSSPGISNYLAMMAAA